MSLCLLLLRPSAQRLDGRHLRLRSADALRGRGGTGRRHVGGLLRQRVGRPRQPGRDLRSGTRSGNLAAPRRPVHLRPVRRRHRRRGARLRSPGKERRPHRGHKFPRRQKGLLVQLMQEKSLAESPLLRRRRTKASMLRA